MVCLGVKPGAARWKVQTNPPSYGGTPNPIHCVKVNQIISTTVSRQLFLMVMASVTRLGDLLDFGILFKAFGNN